MQVLRIRVNFSIGLLISVFKETAFLGAHANEVPLLHYAHTHTLPPFYFSLSLSIAPPPPHQGDRELRVLAL